MVHLVWAPLGPEPLRRFLRSYREHPAGAEHELVVVLNGSGTAATLSRAQTLAELDGTEHRLIELDHPMQDLAAYGAVAHRLAHEQICFLNSYSVILADDWLAKLAHAAALPGVGLVGATGSWESQSPLVHSGSTRRGDIAQHWLYQLATLPRARLDFPRFPNPHIRTTAFLLARQQLLALGFERVRDKHAAYVLENGRHSIARQLGARGLRALVVGRDGRAYETAEWPSSHTYRAGEQENLLVGDNRTEEWRRASPERRRLLSQYAWQGGILHPLERDAARPR